MIAIDPDGPGGPDVLRPVERPVPVPAEGEVLIKVAAAGVNRPDLMQRQGLYPSPPGAPSILGLEIAGEVVAANGLAEEALIGQPVCALVAGGGYAEYAVAPSGSCLIVPEALTMVEAAVAGKAGPVAAPPGAAPTPAPAPAPQPPAAQPPAASADARGWPRLGAYAVGQPVLYSGTAGKTWDRGVVKSIDPQYGYNIEGVTGSTDAYFVVAPQREPFWTGWFVGDWRISVPMAMGTVTDGRNLYRVVTGGMRLPPLRINADGSYSWRVQEGQGETLVQGRWEPNPSGPGVILKAAEKGADWLVYNNSRTGSTQGETIILSSDCCTYQDGSRLK